MAKDVAKFRKNRDYDDEYYDYNEHKKKKKNYSDHRKMKNYRFEDFDFDGGFESYKKRKRMH